MRNTLQHPKHLPTNLFQAIYLFSRWMQQTKTNLCQEIVKQLCFKRTKETNKKTEKKQKKIGHTPILWSINGIFMHEWLFLGALHSLSGFLSLLCIFIFGFTRPKKKLAPKNFQSKHMNRSLNNDQFLKHNIHQLF